MTDPAELDDWTNTVCEVLGLTNTGVDIAAVLDLARDAAHGVARPAAPLTAYLVGIAVGRGASQAEATAIVRRTLPAV
ncbi:MULTISPECIES: DUF6457 domain-containing protein [unclassified Curtobacterium]|uniref:DUF6457 domain-containing protein n=1 Tax=unclassified Curtobacterium TaxID=257496 RepID=UPI001C654015|nr:MULTISPECIES: DUF6457 domain-containing protein [unclassified Curtobacterium]WIE79227.1 DUF6457 domain-containing protein [Curtobacterium sp. MCSS17_016]